WRPEHRRSREPESPLPTNRFSIRTVSRPSSLPLHASLIFPLTPHRSSPQPRNLKMRITKVGVIGAGVMGHGIAALCASAGIPVVLLDIPGSDDPKSP